jgi:hypothetical protein
LRNGAIAQSALAGALCGELKVTETREVTMPGKEDGLIAVQLAQWATELGVMQAALTVLADDFDPASASSSDAAVTPLLEFGETVGTLTKHGLLDTELVRDLWWFDGIWQRVSPAAQKYRDRFGEAGLWTTGLWTNFEALASPPST